MKLLTSAVGFFLFFLSVVSAPLCDAQPQVPSRALYVSMIQDPYVLSSLSQIKKLVQDAQKMKIKVIFIQVYRANQSWFASKYADDSFFQETLASQSIDPLLVLIQEAHRRKIEVHAWVNVLSLSANDKAKILKKFGPQILVNNQKKKMRLRDYKVDDQYFLEPSHPDVRDELRAIFSELVKNYPQLDGIHFDYIRYPDVDPHYGYSPHNIAEFKQVTGQKEIDESSFVWKDWKRKSVTKLLKSLVAQVRKINPTIKVSAAGCMPHVRAYEEAFQDWPYWIDNGLVDFLSLMNYAKKTDVFKRSMDAAMDKTKSFYKVIFSVGAYKFMQDEAGFRQQWDLCRKTAQGCAVFHYENLELSPGLKKYLMK